MVRYQACNEKLKTASVQRETFKAWRMIAQVHFKNYKRSIKNQEKNF